MCTSTGQSSPSSANAALPPHPRLQTSCPPSAYSVSSRSSPSPPSLVPVYHAKPPASSPPITLSGFSNGMLEIFDPRVLNYFTFFRPILLTLSAFRNPTLTHLPLSGFLDSPFCVLIAPTSSLSLPDPYSDYVGVNIFLNNSSSLSFFNVYALPFSSSPTDGRNDSFSLSNLLSSRNFFILGDFNCHHSLWDSRGTSKLREGHVFDWVISSGLLPFNDPDKLTLLHRFCSSRSSHDISFAPSSLVFSCSGEVLQNLGSDHLPILLSIPLSPVFRSNKRSPSFNFQKARCDDFVSYFHSRCLSSEKYLSLSFLCCCSFFFSGTKCGQIFHSFRPNQTPF